MAVVTVIEAVLLAVALVFIVALLRSHADILRRLATLEDGALAPGAVDAGAAAVLRPDARASAEALPLTAAPGAQPAVGVSGTTLDGDAVMLALGAGSPSTLLAFLSSGCGSCAPLWEGLRDPAAARLADRIVVVTHGPERESPSRLARLAPPEAELVMSSDAWSDYAVPASPHFVLTNERGGILGRGSALSWSQLETMLQDARADGQRARSARTTQERAERSEQMLAQAGIGPGHASLYPSGPAGAGGAVSEGSA